MSIVTSTVRPVKARRRTDRTIRLLSSSPDHSSGMFRIKDGDKFDVYYFRSLPSDYGRAFEVQKTAEDDPTVVIATYHVNLHGDESTCECKGHLRWGHCRHVEGLTALIAAGRLS